LTDKVDETISKENPTLDQIRTVKKSMSGAISDSVLKVSKLAIKDGFQVYEAIINLVKDVAMKSARIYMVFKRIEEDGNQIIFSEPSVVDIEKENFDKTVKLFIITKKSTSEIESTISNISEIESVSVEKFTAEGYQTEIPAVASILPPNSPVIKVLLVKIGDQTYAIAISNIERLISLDSQNVKTIEKIEIASVEEEIIPLLDMRDYFGNVKISNARQNAVIVEHESVKCGLVVDDFIKKDEVTVKTLGKIFKNAKEFCGGAILQDDSIALMMDIPYLVEKFSQVLKINVNIGQQHDI